MSDLELLLEKVRAAEAGSRELDAAVWALASGRTLVERVYVPTGKACLCARNPQPPHDEYVVWAEGVDVGSVPPVTTSLDAIVALIERELSGENGGPLLYARAGYWNDSAEDGRPYLQTLSIATSAPTVLTEVEESGATEALALCAALLSAKVRTGSGETGNE